MRKSSKKVLEVAYTLVEDWAANYRNAADTNISDLIDALKKYDEEKFFAHYALGIERALVQLRKEKADGKREGS